MDLFASLEKIGLTPNETQIYLYLLSNQGSSGRQIYEENKMDKSSAYLALKRLENLSLTYSTGKSRNQKFFSHSPSRLHNLWEKEEKELIQVRGQIQSIIENLAIDKNISFKKKNIQVYEGYDEYRIWMEDRLYNSTGIIKELSNSQVARDLAGGIKDYYDYMAWFIPERVKRGLPTRILFDETFEKSLLDHPEITNLATLKEVRLVEGNLKLDSIVALYGTKTAFYSSVKGQFLGVIINDKMIHDLMESMYDFFWNMGKKI